MRRSSVKFIARRSGHTLNYTILSKLQATPEAWSVLEFKSPAMYKAQNIQIPSWGLLDIPARQAA